MRQGQQNRRGRGRGGNNSGRKGQNPLTRSYESNGPDMKIRGTPAHIAEKYMTLSRDALAGGDPVLAENYLQHAEHYNRIILTYREQQTQNSADAVNGSSNPFQRSHGSSAQPGKDLPREEEKAETSGFMSMQPDAPQPAIHDETSTRKRGAGRNSRSSRQDGSRPSRSRNAGGGRRSSSRNETAEGERARPGAAGSEDPREPRRQRNRFGEGDDQPHFLRRPVRRARNGQAENASGEAGPQPTVSQEQAPAQPLTDDTQD